MSHITDVVFMWYLLCPDPDRDADDRFLAEVNALCPDHKKRVLVRVDNVKREGYAMQAQVAVGCFDCLDLREWVSRLRARIDWHGYEACFAQMALQDENDSGFGLLTVYRDEDFSPYDPSFAMEPA